MKILIIALGNFADPTMGGSLLRSVSLAKYAPPSFKVDFLTTSGGEKAIKSEYQPQNIFVARTPTMEDDSSLLFFPTQVVSLLLVAFQIIGLLLKLPRYDMIYLDGDGLWDVIPAILYRLRFPKAKIVVMNHHLVSIQTETIVSTVLTATNRLLQLIAQRFIGCCSDAVFVLETDMGQKIKKVFARLSPLLPVYFVKNGVDGKLIQRIAEPKTKKFTAVFFGYLRPSKGLYQITQIWQEVCKQKPTAKLLILGGISSQYLQYLEKEIAPKGLEKNIVISKYISDKKHAIKLLKQAVLTISPSLEEGWGIALMESQSAGLPGVAWGLSIYRKHFKNSLIFAEKGNISDFAKKIVLLLEDTRLQRKMSVAAQENSRKYNWSEVLKNDYKLFGDIVRR